MKCFSGKALRRTAGRGLAVAAAALLFTGCSGDSAGPEKAAEAAIVPGADLLGRIDYGRYRASPAAETIRNQRLEQDPALAEAEEERSRELKEATGLSPEDLRAVLFTGDLDGIDIGSSNPEGEYLKLNAALAATFDGALTAEQFEAGLKVIARESPGSSVEEAEVGGRKSYALFTDGKADPVLYGSLAADGRTIFLTPNAVSMEGVFLREKEGRSEDLSEALATAGRGVPDDSQFTTAFILPEQLKRQIEERVASTERQAMKNPGAGMILGFLTPFRKLSSLSLGASFGEGIRLGAAADLAGESEAMQAAVIMQTMVLPFLRTRLAQGAQGEAGDLAGKLNVVSQGSNLRFEVNLEGDDLKNIRF